MLCVLWLTVVLCLAPASAQLEEVEDKCDDACEEYFIWGFYCARDANCVQSPSGVNDSCVQRCMRGHRHCKELCSNSSDYLSTQCAKSCGDVSMMDVHCEGECFQDLFQKEFSDQLPEDPQVELWEGLPWSPEDEQLAQEDFDVDYDE